MAYYMKVGDIYRQVVNLDSQLSAKGEVEGVLELTRKHELVCSAKGKGSTFSGRNTKLAWTFDSYFKGVYYAKAKKDVPEGIATGPVFARKIKECRSDTTQKMFQECKDVKKIDDLNKEGCSPADAKIVLGNLKGILERDFTAEEREATPLMDLYGQAINVYGKLDALMLKIPPQAKTIGMDKSGNIQGYSSDSWHLDNYRNYQELENHLTDLISEFASAMKAAFDFEYELGKKLKEYYISERKLPIDKPYTPEKLYGDLRFLKKLMKDSVPDDVSTLLSESDNEYQDWMPPDIEEIKETEQGSSNCNQQTMNSRKRSASDSEGDKKSRLEKQEEEKEEEGKEDGAGECRTQ